MKGTKVQRVLSSDGETQYNIYYYQDRYYCTCPDFLHRNIRAGNDKHECKHIIKMKDELEAYVNRKVGKRSGHRDANDFVFFLFRQFCPDAPVNMDQVDRLAERLLDTIEAYVKEPT
jgi:hypothetical protein